MYNIPSAYLSILFKVAFIQLILLIDFRLKAV